MNKIYSKLFFMGAAAFLLASCAGSDRDKDMIPDKVDECPDASEDKDGFEDNDGCPDLDNDKDGVPDSEDKAPFIAEDRDGFEDNDGVPDKDNDADGIPDNRDKCPDQPEDRDNFEDADGCPDVDNDGDGVLDSRDKCPQDPEDKDNFQDDDGCAEADNDADGIKDNFDKCPNQAETFNGKDDDDGCPDVDADPIPDSTSINLRFETGTENLTYEDKVLLEQKFIAGLKAYPDHKIYVYVFMARNDMELPEYLDLINKRTAAVSAFLESKGVNRAQIRTRQITPELLEANKGTAEDFDSSRPALFKRK